MCLFRTRAQNKLQSQRLNYNLLELDPDVLLRKWSIPRALIYKALLRLKSLRVKIHVLSKKPT